MRENDTKERRISSEIFFSVGEESVSSDRLLDRLRSGDQQIASEIVRRIHAPLVELVRRRFRGPGRARNEPEDIVQSTFRSFFNGLLTREYAPADTQELWALLVVIATRKCQKTNRYWSAAKRSSHRVDESLDVAQVAKASDMEFDLEFEDTLRQISEELTEIEKLIFSGVLEGLSLRQIALRTGRSERTVQRVSKGIRESLRYHLSMH